MTSWCPRRSSAWARAAGHQWASRASAVGRPASRRASRASSQLAGTSWPRTREQHGHADTGCDGERSATAAARWWASTSASPRGCDAPSAGWCPAPSGSCLGSDREWGRRRRRSADRSPRAGGTAARSARVFDRLDMAGIRGDSTSDNSIPATYDFFIHILCFLLLRRDSTERLVREENVIITLYVSNVFAQT